MNSLVLAKSNESRSNTCEKKTTTLDLLIKNIGTCIFNKKIRARAVPNANSMRALV